MQNDVGQIALVLTGTISPQGPLQSINNSILRKQEYLNALDFYAQTGLPIYFLENSGHLLNEDESFQTRPHINLRPRPLSLNPERGKGYQEFEMISGWLANETKPPARWLKITGRYLISNIDRILHDCTLIKSNFLIDQAPRTRTARTYLFYTTTSFYMRHLLYLYKECDDRNGSWVEKVLFDYLKNCTVPDIRFFRTRARMSAISGSTGLPYPNGFFESNGKQILRNINSLFDRRYLWFSN